MRLFTRYKHPGPLKPTPNPYPSRTHPLRGRASLGIFLFLLFLSGWFRFHGASYQALSSLLFEGTAWIQMAVVHPFQVAHTLLKESYTAVHLKKEHQHLLQENKVLKEKLQKFAYLQTENRKLRQILKIPCDPSYHQLTARVVASPYDGAHSFFLISAGRPQNLKPDQAVVAPCGIVGRTEKIGRHTSRVLLLTDKSSRIPVMTETSNLKAILTGEGLSFPSLVYITNIQHVQKGERVLTSGLGGIFPPGLPVGKVEDVKNGKIRVRPYVFFPDLEWVQVLSPHSGTLSQEMRTGLEDE